MPTLEEMMADIPKPTARHYRSEIMWFAPVKTASLEAIEVQLQGDKLKERIGIDYDLERLEKDNHYILHIDFTIDMPVEATIVTRSSYKIFAWPHHFRERDFIHPKVTAAMAYCHYSFNEQLKINGKASSTLPELSDPKLFFTDHLILRLCIEDDICRRPHVYFRPALMLSGSMTLGCGLYYAFTITDEMLFNNDHVKRRKNRKAFDAIIPLATYYTIRGRWKHNQWGRKTYTIRHAIYLAHIFEFCIHVLLGKHYTTIKDELEQKKLPPDCVTDAIGYLEEAMDAIKDGLNLPYSNDQPFTVNYDWNELVE